MATQFLHRQEMIDRFRHSKQFYFVITDTEGKLVYANPLFLIRIGHATQKTPALSVETIIANEHHDKCFNAIEKCLRYAGNFVTDPLCLKLKGSASTICWELSALRNEAEEPEGIQWLGIEQENKTGEQPAHKESLYRNLVADILDAAVLTDEKGLITYASLHVQTILGYEPDEIVNKVAFDFIHPEDRQHSMDAFFSEVERAPKARFVYARLQQKSGEWLWCMIRGHNLLANPYIGAVLISFFDDTKRRNAELALTESEKRLRNQGVILNNVYDVIVTTDLELNITSWNKIAEEISGVFEKEAIGTYFPDLIQIDYSSNTPEEVAHIVFTKGIWEGEISFNSRGGEKIFVLQTMSLLQDQAGLAIGLLGVGKDITERKEVEKKLRESEQFYRGMIANSLDGIVMTDAGGRITYCGPSVKKILGYETDELLGKTLFSFVHHGDVDVAKEAFILELSKETQVHYILIRIRHFDCTWRWCSVRGHNLLDSPGINSMVVYFTEETHRKEMEDRLRESEQRFRHLIQHLNLGVILVDEKGNIMIANKATAEMFETAEEALIGINVINSGRDIIHENGEVYSPDNFPVAIALKKRIGTRNAVMGIKRFHTEERMWLLVGAEPVFDINGNLLHVISYFTDITEQKRLSRQLTDQEIQKQKQLIQATIDGQEKERKEIGRELHDNISQHITTTRLYLEVAKEKAEGEVLRMINLAHKGLLDTVSEVRQLSQSLVPPSLSDIGLVESVQDICFPLKYTHSFEVDFQYNQFNEELLPENMKLMLFRIIQEQINNIIRHAEATTIHINLQTEEGYILLSIADNGKGFDAKTQKKGVGFNSITNRAGLFGGRLKIDAAPGKGCTIHVTIPLQK